jgi:hypothetical protein
MPHDALPGREQLADTFRGLSTAVIRGKLDSGELTAVARAVAEAELSRRARDGEDVSSTVEPDPHAPVDPNGEILDFLAAPFGWTWTRWLVLLTLGVIIVSRFGTSARNPGDQGFLYGVIFVQAALLTGIVRAVAAVFRYTSLLGLVGKVLAIGLLGYALFGLVVCSIMAQGGWRGG